MTLIPLDPECCPTCATRLYPVSWVERPLLRHGGYGAGRRHLIRACPECGWCLAAEVSEVRP